MNKNVPNILTMARVAAVPFYVICYYKNLYLAALVIFCLASLTDMLDGKIARKYNLISNFGKIMDPLADKILTYSAIIVFVEQGISYYPAYFLMIMLAREFLIAGLRSVAAAQGIVIAADMAGKVKTVLQMASIILTILSFIININIIGILSAYVTYVAVIMTVISGVLYVAHNKQVFANN